MVKSEVNDSPEREVERERDTWRDETVTSRRTKTRMMCSMSRDGRVTNFS